MDRGARGVFVLRASCEAGVRLDLGRPAAHLRELAGLSLSEAAEVLGPVRAELERIGRPIGAYDTLIAAHALSRGLVLVTANVGEFQRVDGLRIENWQALEKH